MRGVGARRTGTRKGFFNLWRREVGDIAPRSFADCTRASEELVRSLGLHKKLRKHRGCVNTLSFSADGNILLSGSDDRMMIMWDWEVGIPRLLFDSGHNGNVLHARFMPYTENQVIITCGADGQVRLAHLLEGGVIVKTMLAKREGWIHKMAIEPGSPHTFYSCGEDGVVLHFDLRTKHSTKLFTCRPLQDMFPYVQSIQLYAIAIDPRNPHLFAVAGSDEYAWIYDIRRSGWERSSDASRAVDCFCPPHLIGDELDGISGLAFSETSELLVSYINEDIYLFSSDRGLFSNDVPLSAVPLLDEDTNNGFNLVSKYLSSLGSNVMHQPQVFKGHRNRETVKGVSFFGPNCEYITSGSDCGRIFFWRKKDGELIRVMEADRLVVNCIESHPSITMVASSGIESDIKIWTPDPSEHASPVRIHEVGSPRWFSSNGDSDSYNGNDHDDDSVDDYNNDESDTNMDLDSEDESNSGSDDEGDDDVDDEEVDENDVGNYLEFEDGQKMEEHGKTYDNDDDDDDDLSRDGHCNVNGLAGIEK